MPSGFAGKAPGDPDGAPGKPPVGRGVAAVAGCNFGAVTRGRTGCDTSAGAAFFAPAAIGIDGRDSRAAPLPLTCRDPAFEFEGCTPRGAATAGADGHGPPRPRRGAQITRMRLFPESAMCRLPNESKPTP